MTTTPAAKAGIVIGLLLLTATSLTGCVRRTLTITTEPPDTLVFLNDLEIGRSSTTVDFLWYGDYDVVLRKDGYETLKTHWDIKAPWYQIVPLDFFAEVLWPGHIRDTHEKHFVLTEQTTPTTEELLSNANELRVRAFDARR